MTAIWCGDPTWIAPNFGFLKMCNFYISVVHLGFGAILGDPKFGSIHVGSPHHVAVTGYTWLIVVINCNNEVCSCSNNTVSKAFWQKKVLPEQRISCCGVIYRTRVYISVCCLPCQNHWQQYFKAKQILKFSKVYVKSRYVWQVVNQIKLQCQLQPHSYVSTSPSSPVSATTSCCSLKL